MERVSVIALFISSFVNNKKVFLPVFMGLILCNTLFVQDGNFTSVSIAESAADRPASIIESWKPGRFSIEEYDEAKLAQDRLIADGGTVDEEDKLPDHYMTSWEQIKYDGEKTDRVELDSSLKSYVKKYEQLLATLLEEDETFVDFMNKTLLFSLINRENPVYVSQSPLQLSGEFTQEEFVKEIKGVPLVLMPVDADNYRASNSLDGLTNAYRYYKVAEYIYQNYQPLCQYGKDYAVWCLNDRTDAYKTKLEDMMNGVDYVNSLAGSETIGRGNVELTSGEGGSVIMKFTGTDPMITELQTLIDTSGYIDGELQICVEYSTDVDGAMQLFYTTDKGENYVGEKVVTENISGAGTAFFTVPITEYSRLRLDTPEGSSVEIKSLVVKSPINLITYGYDGPVANADASGNISYAYTSALHNHNIGQLPRIWAEGDKDKASENQVLAEVTYQGDTYTFDPVGIKKDAGNYLLFSASYDGSDTGGLFYDDDEQVGATVIMGKYENGVFEEKCRYGISVKEGTHNYLIRCSTDYYWYLNEINAVKIGSDGALYDVSMKILEGD